MFKKQSLSPSSITSINSTIVLWNPFFSRRNEMGLENIYCVCISEGRNAFKHSCLSSRAVREQSCESKNCNFPARQRCCKIEPQKNVENWLHWSWGSAQSEQWWFTALCHCVSRKPYSIVHVHFFGCNSFFFCQGAFPFPQEKVSFHSNPKERQCQRMFKLPHDCIHFTCEQGNAQNPPS